MNNTLFSFAICVIDIGEHNNRRYKRQFAAFRFEFGENCRTRKRSDRIADIHCTRNRPRFWRQRTSTLRADCFHARTIVLPGGPQPWYDQFNPWIGLRDGSQADGYRHRQRLGGAIPVRQHDPSSGCPGHQRQPTRIRAATLRGYYLGIITGQFTGMRIYFILIIIFHLYAIAFKIHIPIS